MESQDKKLIPLIAILMASIAISLSISSQKPVTIGAQNILTVAATNLAATKPELSAHAYLVRIMGEQNPLLKQREWKMLPPASLSKLLTAVVAKEYLRDDERVIFSASAKNPQEDGEKLSTINIGESLSKEDTLKLLLISSANDAAIALSEKLGGEEVFRKLADKKAQEIGLSSSYFLNPSGLDQPGHKTSGEDLARLAEYIWQYHPEIWEITRNINANIYSKSGHEYKIENTNKLLEEFPGILGGKTGFTDNAGESLILLYPVRPGKPPYQEAAGISHCTGANPWCGGKVAVIVILRSDDRFGDARKIIKWIENGI